MKQSGIWDLSEAIWEHVHSLPLAVALKDILDQKTIVLDIGCGVGFYSEFLRKRGYTVLSYEGTSGIESIGLSQHILPIDLTKQNEFVFNGQVISLEVGEHIPEIYEDIYIHNITKVCKGKLILSWGIPGQGGFGHVNCKPNEYIIEKIEAKGFKLNIEQSNYLRKHAGNCTWFEKTILVFDKEIK
jgi:hypothetical protein